MEAFLSKFHFDPELKGAIGVEREFFLMKEGEPVPEAKRFLERIPNQTNAWTNELSACQVEFRTRPAMTENELRKELFYGEDHGETASGLLGLELSRETVGPRNMSLEVFPEERYMKIAKSIPLPKLRAACRVVGTHIHFGVASMAEALVLYNRMVEGHRQLLILGNRSGGMRHHLYKEMAGSCEPKPYWSIEAFYENAVMRGFAENPRDCYDLVRISQHGTVELRMFDAAESIDEIMEWVRKASKLREKTRL